MRIPTTLTTVSLATGPIARHLWKFAAMSADMFTVARFARMLGMDDAWVKRWGSAIGRKVAKAYRTATGEEPRTAWDVSVRGLKRHMAYPAGRHVKALGTIVLEYMIRTELETHLETA